MICSSRQSPCIQKTQVQFEKCINVFFSNEQTTVGLATIKFPISKEKIIIDKLKLWELLAMLEAKFILGCVSLKIS